MEPLGSRSDPLFALPQPRFSSSDGVDSGLYQDIDGGIGIAVKVNAEQPPSVIFQRLVIVEVLSLVQGSEAV